MADRIFISHASEDAAVADRIVAYLEARGVPCWISSRDIPPRAIYADAIVEGMQSCGACAVLVSAASNASKAVKRELELASHEDKPFIPIRLDSSEPASGMAYYLRNAQWIDYSRQGELGLARIAAPGSAISKAPVEPQASPLSRQGVVGKPVWGWRLIALAIAATNVTAWFAPQNLGSSLFIAWAAVCFAGVVMIARAKAQNLRWLAVIAAVPASVLLGYACAWLISGILWNNDGFLRVPSDYLRGSMMMTGAALAAGMAAHVVGGLFRQNDALLQ